MASQVTPPCPGDAVMERGHGYDAETGYDN